MRWRRSKRKRICGDYPDSFVRRWMAHTLPSATPAEAASAVGHLRSTGWTAQQLAESILPYLPRDTWPPAAGPEDRADATRLPPNVTSAWLQQHLPSLDRRELRCVVDELERRGWPSGAVAAAVLPHLLPKLSAEDARAVVAGLAELGLTDEEMSRATARPESPR